MSYIFIDFDESRRCAALLDEQARHLAALLDNAPAGRRQEIEAFQKKLAALIADLSAETEKLAAIDDRMKMQHHLLNDERSADHGKE